MSHMCLHIRHYYRHLHSLETFIMDNALHFPLPTFSSFSTVNSQPLNVQRLTFKVGLDVLHSVSDMIPPFSCY